MKVTSYSFGGNSLAKFRSGTIYLREEPRWLAFAGYLIDLIGYGCRPLHWIVLPNWIKVKREGHEYSLQEYYGSIGDLYHLFVYSPLFQWHWSHAKATNTNVHVGYDKLKELFVKHNPEYFAECDKSAIELDPKMGE